MLIIGNNTDHHSNTPTALARATRITAIVSSMSDSVPRELLVRCGFDAAAISEPSESGARTQDELDGLTG
jgi:hypothetical protein